DEEAAVAIEREAVGRGELRVGCRAAVAAEAVDPGAGDSADDAAGDAADDARLLIGDIDVATSGGGEARRGHQRGVRRRAAIAGVGGDAGAGEGRDDAVGGAHRTHDVVVLVGDVEVARGIERDGDGEVEGGLRRGAVVAAVAGAAVPGDGRDDAGRGIDAANAVVELIGDVEAAGAIDGEAEQSGERGLGGGAAIADGVGLLRAGGAAAGEGRDHATGIDVAHDVAAGAGDVEAAGAI